MSSQRTLALVGAVGGAGTTRLAVECGALLAVTGHDVALVDADFATQGLADYVPGRVDADVTTVVTDDDELDDALSPVTTDFEGALDAAPVRAPFKRLARAKTAGAAERFERQIAAAGLSYDVVVADVPPVAANPAVAAVNATDRAAVVAPDTVRGADGLARVRARLDDIGAGDDGVVATLTDRPTVIEEADLTVPEHDVTAPGECPVAQADTDAFGPAICEVVETLLDLDLGITFEEPGRIERLFPGGS